MNAPYGHGMQRSMSAGMPPGAQAYQLPPQSPAARHNSFSMQNSGGPQGQYSSHPPLHSPAQQQQGGPMHPGVTQMHRGSSQSRPAHMGMQSMQQTHDPLMGSSSGGRAQQYMGNSMGGSMDNSMNSSMNNSMNNSMNGSMNSNSMMPMANSMNVPMGSSMNGGMQNIGGPMNAMGSGSLNSRGNSANPSLGNSSGNAMSSGSSGLNGNWQSERDTQHRRDMIHHMYVPLAYSLIPTH
eukprot:scaffold2526_cov131-Cylindrotheca_fusiformis.AAC.12